MALRINDMIKNTSGRRQEILRRLKKLNRLAERDYFLAPGYLFGYTFKKKYAALQTSKIWSEARDLILEFYFLENDLDLLVCEKCKRKITKFIMHHDSYNNSEIFTPDFVNIVCNKCHSRIHQRY